ncbi:MAG: hypothetical protein OXU20_01655 [Myxococcales bacterium]|nr:hypothetical protein [Myxococcales bacterium]
MSWIHVRADRASGTCVGGAAGDAADCHALDVGRGGGDWSTHPLLPIPPAAVLIFTAERLAETVDARQASITSRMVDAWLARARVARRHAGRGVADAGSRDAAVQDV